MEMPDEIVRREMDPGWRAFVDNLEKSLELLELESNKAHFNEKIV